MLSGIQLKVIKYVACLKNFLRKEWARIAFITFGTVAKLEFNWGQAMVDTPEKTTEAIRKVKYMGGATASAIALRKVRTEVVPFALDDRKRVLVFITDGKSNIGGPPEKEADFLKSKERFEIFAVGMFQRLFNPLFNTHTYCTLSLSLPKGLSPSLPPALFPPSLFLSLSEYFELNI